MQRNHFHNKNPQMKKKKNITSFKKKIFNQETPVVSSRWSSYKKPSPTHAWFKYSFQRKPFDEIRELNIKNNGYQLQKTVLGVTAGQLSNKELTAVSLSSLSKCFRTWHNFIKAVISKSYEEKQQKIVMKRAICTHIYMVISLDGAFRPRSSSSKGPRAMCWHQPQQSPSSTWSWQRRKNSQEGTRNIGRK